MEREFRARNLSPEEYRRIEQAREDAIRHLGDPGITDKELLMLLVNDTGPTWRRGR